ACPPTSSPNATPTSRVRNARHCNEHHRQARATGDHGMSTGVDIMALAAPLEGDAPSGPDLEYDAGFMALEGAVAPRGERVVGGDDGEADEPDWDRLATSALALLERTRDLRVAVILGTAWLRMHGLPGWRDGLALVLAMLEQHWESVHPQLDAEDDNDPTARVNALMPLADPQGPLGY